MQGAGGGMGQGGFNQAERQRLNILNRGPQGVTMLKEEDLAGTGDHADSVEGVRAEYIAEKKEEIEELGTDDDDIKRFSADARELAEEYENIQGMEEGDEKKTAMQEWTAKMQGFNKKMEDRGFSMGKEEEGGAVHAVQTMGEQNIEAEKARDKFFKDKGFESHKDFRDQLYDRKDSEFSDDELYKIRNEWENEGPKRATDADAGQQISGTNKSRGRKRRLLEEDINLAHAGEGLRVRDGRDGGGGEVMSQEDRTEHQKVVSDLKTKVDRRKSRFEEFKDKEKELEAQTNDESLTEEERASAGQQLTDLREGTKKEFAGMNVNAGAFFTKEESDRYLESKGLLEGAAGRGGVAGNVGAGGVSGVAGMQAQMAQMRAMGMGGGIGGGGGIGTGTQGAPVFVTNWPSGRSFTPGAVQGFMETGGGGFSLARHGGLTSGGFSAGQMGMMGAGFNPGMNEYTGSVSGYNRPMGISGGLFGGNPAGSYGGGYNSRPGVPTPEQGPAAGGISFTRRTEHEYDMDEDSDTHGQMIGTTITDLDNEGGKGRKTVHSGGETQEFTTEDGGVTWTPVEQETTPPANTQQGGAPKENNNEGQGQTGANPQSRLGADQIDQSAPIPVSVTNWNSLSEFINRQTLDEQNKSDDDKKRDSQDSKLAAALESLELTLKELDKPDKPSNDPANNDTGTASEVTGTITLDGGAPIVITVAGDGTVSSADVEHATDKVVKRLKKKVKNISKYIKDKDPKANFGPEDTA